jgi:predicted permease
MVNFILIFACLAIGLLLRWSGKLSEHAAGVVNTLVITFSLPAVVLTQIPKLLHTHMVNQQMLLPILMPWFQLLIAFVVFGLIGHSFKWSRARTGAIILTAGLGNTSFLGFPLLQALIGPSALPVGVLTDQLGTFLALATAGLILAAYFSGSAISAKAIASRIVRFPPFIALLFALFWFLSGLYRPETQITDVITGVCSRIGETLIPLALLSVGMRLNIQFKSLRGRWLPLSLGLLFKLVFAPLLLLTVTHFFGMAHGEVFQATLLESAMAPMITAAIVASDFHLDSEIASLMVGLGIPLSLLSVPAWHALLN